MRRNFSWFSVSILAVALLVIGGVMYFASQVDRVNQGVVPGIGGGPNDTTTISDIVRDPDRYLGQSIVVKGEVDRVLQPRVFVIDQEGTILGDEVLVITRTPLPEQSERDRTNPFQNADKITVSGIVRRLFIPEIEAETGVNLNQNVERDFRDKLVIVATDVRLTSPQ